MVCGEEDIDKFVRSRLSWAIKYAARHRHLTDTTKIDIRGDLPDMLCPPPSIYPRPREVICGLSGRIEIGIDGGGKKKNLGKISRIEA